jgi:hypothetical protein
LKEVHGRSFKITTKHSLTKYGCAPFSSQLLGRKQRGEFVLKVLNADKAKKVREGYVCMLQIKLKLFQLIDKKLMLEEN